MYLEGAYVYGNWATATITLDNLANASIATSAAVNFAGAFGIEVESVISGTAAATAYLNVAVERVGSDGVTASAYENAAVSKPQFFSATPNVFVRYFEGPFAIVKFAVENKTGAALSVVGNTLKYRTVTPRNTVTA